MLCIVIFYCIFTKSIRHSILKLMIMKTANEMNQAITNIVTEAIEAAKGEANFYNRAVTLTDFNNELECLLIPIRFENQNAENTFKGLCISALSKVDAEFKEFVQPKMAMDANGNYTIDKALWV